MAPLRFRAWHKTDNHMLEWDDGRFVDQSETLPSKPNVFTPNYCERHPDEFAVMQTTGLTDRNNKEIFEGDVVQIHVDNQYTNAGPGISKATAIYRLHVVEHIQGGWHSTTGLQFRPLTPAPGYVETGSGEMQVIGDIYQNPELLK